VHGRIRLEPPRGLVELALAGDRAPCDGRVIPGNGDVDEALEEVALGRLRHSPGALERLVGGEVLPACDQLEAVLVAGLDGVLRPRP